MKDETLGKLLKSIKIPPIDSAARERAKHRALIAFNNGSSSPEPQKSWGWLGLLTSTAAALVVCIFSLALPFQPPSISTTKGQVLAQNRRVLSEFETLFLGRFTALVESPNELEVRLAEEAISQSSQPLVITLAKQGESLRILSYSGRTICIQLGGQKTCMEVLAGGDGGVIIAGTDFVWSQNNPAMIHGYRIEAHLL